jgi:hypothetical protein
VLVPFTLHLSLREPESLSNVAASKPSADLSLDEAVGAALVVVVVGVITEGGEVGGWLVGLLAEAAAAALAAATKAEGLIGAVSEPEPAPPRERGGRPAGKRER